MLLLTGPAARLLPNQGSPQSTPVNTPFPMPLQALVLDSANDPVWGATVTFSGPTSGAGANCVPASATTDANGLAQTTCTANAVAGSYVVNANMSALTPAAFHLTNTAGTAAAVLTNGGSPQSTTVETVFAQPLSALVVDGSNNPVAGVSVTFAGPSSGASATCVPASATTDASGLAVTTCTANAVAGSYAVNASVGALPPATFDLTNTAGPAAAVRMSSGSPQSAVVNTVFAQPLQALVVDASNNPVAGVSVTFASPSDGASADCVPATAMTDASGLAQTTCTANAVAGSYVVGATVGALTPAAFDLTNTNTASAPVVVCTLPTQVGTVGDSVNLNLGLLFSAPGQTMTYSASHVPSSLSLDANTGLLTGVLSASDLGGSPYAATLTATTSGGSASENVTFQVLADGELLLRSGFEDSASQECQ